MAREPKVCSCIRRAIHASSASRSRRRALCQFLPVPAKGRPASRVCLAKLFPGILQVLPHRLHPRLQGVLLRPQLGQLGLLTGQVGLQGLPAALLLRQVCLGPLGPGFIGPHPVPEKFHPLTVVPELGFVVLELGP